MQVKVMFYFKKLNFYLHNRHPAWLIGVCVMQVKVLFLTENINFYLHNRHLVWLLCK